MKQLHFLALLISLSFVSYGQTSLGIKSGANLSTVGFNPSITSKPLILYNVGVIFKHFEKEEHAGVQLELNLSQKGWIETIDSVNSYSRRISYVELPFMSQFYTGTYKSNLFFQLGPYLGYGISAKEKEVVNDVEETRKYRFTSSDNRFDLGVVAGIGIKQQYSFGIFQLEGRFSYGVSNAVKTIGVRNFSGSKNMAITVSLAYLLDYKSFRLKRKIPNKSDKPLPSNQ